MISVCSMVLSARGRVLSPGTLTSHHLAEVMPASGSMGEWSIEAPRSVVGSERPSVPLSCHSEWHAGALKGHQRWSSDSP